MKYANIDNIKELLKSKVNLEENSYFGSLVTSSKLDFNLLNQIINTTELWIDSILEQIYELPLVDKEAIEYIGYIVDRLVASDIIKTHYSTSNNFSAEVIDEYRKLALEKLYPLVAGKRIVVPGMQNLVSGDYLNTPQATVLPRTNIKINPPDIVTRVNIVVGNRAKKSLRANNPRDEIDFFDFDYLKNL